MGIIARQSIKGTIVTYLGVAIGFVTTFVVLTRFLTTEEIGLARVMIDTAALFVGLAQLGTSTSIIRFFPYFKDNTPTSNRFAHHGFFFWMLVIPFVGFIFFASVFWICKTPISHWFSEKSQLFIDYYYFVLPMAFFLLYETIFETCANVLMRIVVPRMVRELIVRLGWLIIYLLYAFRVLSMDGFVMALALNYALAALINIIYLCAVGHLSFRPDFTFLRNHHPLLREYGLYTGFLIISALASVLAPALSSFFITAQMGLSYTGIFAIATYMAVMVSIPYRSLTAIASPQLAMSIKNNDRLQCAALVQQVCNNTFLVGVFIFLAIWINIDLIYHILPNGNTFASAREVVFILACSQLIVATFSITQAAISYSRYYAFTLLFSCLLTILSILFNNTFIPLWGMNGAAISNLLAYAVFYLLFILTTCLALKVSPFSRSLWMTGILWITVLVINELWLRFIPTGGLWCSSIIRSVVLLGAAAHIAYHRQFSPEINDLVRSCIAKVRHQRPNS